MSTEDINIEHSKLNMASYGFGSFSREFVQMAFNVLVFFYYEVEIGLNVWLIGLALVIFALYNAVNDPLIGYLTNRPFGFTRKWGRRFPWLLVGGIPLGVSYFLIFTPPTSDPTGGALILFLWLIFTTCLFDTLHSLFFVNFQSLFPDKFRSVNERRNATGIQIIIGAIGVSLGAMIPPLFITYGDLETYIIQGVIVIIITVASMLLAIPGFREDQATINLYLDSIDKQPPRTSFIDSLKEAVKQQSFLAYMFLYTMYWITINSMQASIPYVVKFVLNMPSSATTPLMAGFLAGAIFSIPLWVKVAKKIDNNGKVMLIGSLLMGIYILPMLFLKNYILIIINVFIWGTAQGAYWAMIFPVFADVIDESVVRLSKREEGTLIGVQQFFGRLGLILQVMSFAVIHELTGFVEGSDTQTPLAVLGIHLHLALVPSIAILLGVLVFWKWYNLTPSKISEHQLKIRQLKL